MRAAVLADIHGNLPALDAVLRDIERTGADLIVLNGDIADGPMPDRTLERLAGLGDRAVWVQGNADRWLVDAFDGDLLVPGLATSHFRAAFSGVPARTVVVGHTHMPFDRLADGRRVVNAGSVGLQYGHAGASWALLGPGVTLRRTLYDADGATAAMRAVARDLPGSESFITNVRAPVGDAQALEAFTQTIRQQSRGR